jgi:hypothetical protein
MKDIFKYTNRFKSLLESEMGNVKPLIKEDIESEVGIDMERGSDNDMDSKGMSYEDVKKFQDDFINSKVDFDLMSEWPKKGDDDYEYKLRQVMRAEENFRELVSQAGMDIFRSR